MGRFPDMQDKVALVTGAASGIGEACARQFAAEGCRVVALDVNADRLDAVMSDLGDAARGVTGDVRSEDTHIRAVETCLSEFGRIDYAANAAGVAGNSATVDQTSLEEWERVTSINMTGVFLGMKHQMRAMLAAGRGSITNLSSGAGIGGTPRLSPYCASKHAVLGLTKAAAMEVAPRGLRINAVLPGTTRTPMVEGVLKQGAEVEQMILNSLPSGRMGTADEIAAAVLWLCSEQASYVNGHSLVVDGAFLCR